MDLGTFFQDIVYATTVGAWIGFVAPPIIWLIRHRHNMPWERHRSSIENSWPDYALGLISLLCLGLLLRI